MKIVCVFLEWLDGRLDAIPDYEEGRWYRHGGWGCRLRMSRLWDKEEYWDKEETK